MKTYLGWTAALVLAAGTLSGCGNSTEDYCNSLEEAQSDFASLEGGDVGGFGDAINRMQEIGADAPEEVAEDWEVLTGALDDMEQTLEDAGLSFEDLASPEELDPEQLEALQALGEDEAFSALESEEVTTASDDIAQHADDECGIQLN